jgi:hypothetical protein
MDPRLRGDDGKLQKNSPASVAEAATASAIPPAFLQLPAQLLADLLPFRLLLLREEGLYLAVEVVLDGLRILKQGHLLAA